MANSKVRRKKTQRKSNPQVSYENPIILPELVNISGNETHIILRFGYKKHDKSFVIHTSIALTYEQAEDFAIKIQEAIVHDKQ